MGERNTFLHGFCNQQYIVGSMVTAVHFSRKIKQPARLVYEVITWLWGIERVVHKGPDALMLMEGQSLKLFKYDIN